MSLHTFSWKGEGKDVNLLGSFDEWRPRVMTENDDDGFEITLSLPPGRYEYKFVVDGIHCYNPHQIVAPDGQGGLNNICEITGVLPGDEYFQSETETLSTLAAIPSPLQSQPPTASIDPSYSQGQCFSPKSPHLFTIKITCLPKTATSEKLCELVEKYGKVMNSPINIQGSSNKYAWVNFASLEDAQNVVENLNDYCFEGKSIKISLKSSSSPNLVKMSPPIVLPVSPAVQPPKKRTSIKKTMPQAKSQSPQESEPSQSRSQHDQMYTHPQCSSVEGLLLKIKYELERNNLSHQENISQLTQQRDQIQIPKECPPDLLVLQAEKTDLAHKISESENRLGEFNAFCTKLCTMAQEATGVELVSMESLEKSFARECSRFQKGLPIYSHRQEIVEMIRGNQVSILTAETGSGKSTQLVQYLYEDGFADSGVIVCTQPRKVAAMSLAKYVSSEMLANPGAIVGYKTGLHGNYTAQTKVIYMTDHTLLNECVEDSNFSKYSCLIVDEAHERNLNTDVLLAFIKRCLPSRPELRVVITSATIDPKSFTQYFGHNCPVKKVPGRTFPVDVTYCPLDTAQTGIPRGMPDYVFGAVSLANTLHCNEPPGDVLVFLTSPVEVEQACQRLETFTNNSAVVLPLHGKLQPDDQQKVFVEYPQRKIVFSTNVAETSVTIPGVKYIVDSGRAKELCYDTKKNMNSLEVRLISKSSAEQRKGRAGRMSAGKCYRLYSEETYRDMSKRMVPEILRVSLAGTVLKLHELGIRDVLTFDFIEKPEESALKFAVEILEFLGAVSTGRLTNIGKSMAALPINPRLAKVILDGLVEKVGREAIAVASISSLAGTIFFQGGTQEMKERSALLKTKFCDSHGDQLTYFNTYCHWEARLPQDRNAWCVENSINAKSMRIVHEMIKDLTEIVRKQLKITVPSSTLSLQEASEKLPKILFKAFANNLCAFLGHEKIGYFNPNLPDEKLVIFPGSSLCTLSLQPKLLVYEKTLKTSQHFLLQVFPVEEEWVQEALRSGIIGQHPSSCEQFKKRSVTSFVIEDLGESVISTVVRNQRKILEQASTVTSNQAQFVATPEQGMLKVFVQESFRDPLQLFLQQYIKNLKEEMKCYCHEAGVTADGDNVRVLVGSGGSVTQTLMPHEYRCLVARGPLVGTWHEELMGRLGECGAVLSQKMNNFQKEKKLWITFHNSKDAEKASKVSIPPGVSLLPQLPKKEDGLSEFSLTVKIEWSRRDRKNFVNIDFRSTYLSTILSQLSNSGATIGGCMIRFKTSKYKDSHIFANNVPPHVPEGEVFDAFDRLLAPLGYLRGSYDVKFSYSPPFETTPEEHEALEAKLQSFIPPMITRGNYTLRLLKPENFHKLYVAYLNFLNIDDGMIALDSLESVSIDGKPLQVSRSHSSSIKYSPAIYAAIQESLLEVSTSVEAQHPLVEAKNVKDKSGNPITKIESNDSTEYVAVLRMFNSVLRPALIQCSSQLRCEYMRSKRCEEDMARIEGLSSTVVKRDFRLKCIKIYGTKENSIKALGEFEKCLSFDGDAKYYEVELKESGQPPGLLKYLITTFGIDVGLLAKQEGIEMVRIDIRKHKLILFASNTGYQLILGIIKQFIQMNASKAQATPSSTEDEVECCACYTPIDDPKDTYRLEYCGHAYHIECVEAQLTPNTITIPVLCAADGCEGHFVWQDFKNLESKKKVEPRDIITESVRSYLAANQELVHSCPTPDCAMVYAVTAERGCFFCSHCGVLTCTKCHKPFHSGLMCKQLESAPDADKSLAPDADKSLEQWLDDDTNRKRCPQCCVPIERYDGCNRVYCPQCKAHVCWVCLAFFPSSQECYTHLGDTHGGFW